MQAFRLPLGFRLLLLSCSVLSLGTAYAQLGLGDILGSRDKAQQARAVQQAKQIGIALFTFENDRGKLPAEGTVEEIQKLAKDGVTVAAKSANDCFFQLVVAGYLEDVKVFSLDRNQPRVPAVALKKIDHCFFAYLPSKGFSEDSARPLVVAPLVAGKKTFDPKPLGGKAVVMLTDLSVRLMEIDDAGQVKINGRDLFDPAQPYWRKDEEPVVKWPE